MANKTISFQLYLSMITEKLDAMIAEKWPKKKEWEKDDANC